MRKNRPRVVLVMLSLTLPPYPGHNSPPHMECPGTQEKVRNKKKSLGVGLRLNIGKAQRHTSNAENYPQRNQRCIHEKKKKKNRWAAEIGQWLEHRLLFQRSRVQFPAPTWKLPAVCNSNSRASDTLTHTCMQAKRQ